MASDEAKRTTIAIFQRNKDALDSIKHPGQSYDGVIQELITFWERRHPVSESVSEPVSVGGLESK